MMTPEVPKPASRLANFTPSPSTMIVSKRRKVQFSPEQASSLLSTSLHIHSSYMNQNFITLSKLGEGDFGEVKEVKSKLSSSKFAIKIFKVDKMKIKSGMIYTKTNQDEIRAHFSLPSHPNLIQFYHAWKEDGYLYLQMELSEYSLNGLKIEE
ncbi:hypothetical protein PRIPAC_72097 [Pristionchus pacificus]|uniref:non-specific serine/threonine protein kinase n=1 Tax=Pristionchus pacificus TaxID=54126 RepID=A0A2A6CAI4_PRIPA|nr:hypothetical protein PRIPAC_72097 [Pristionchus pacificus]|eukprot:PDM75116.1 protein kinase [Pristionchus pacificus]